MGFYLSSEVPGVLAPAVANVQEEAGGSGDVDDHLEDETAAIGCAKFGRHLLVKNLSLALSFGF